MTCSRGHTFEKSKDVPTCPSCWPGKYKTVSFDGLVWLYPGAQASWHFVTVPSTLSAALKQAFGKQAKGWGSLPVSATVGDAAWKTSIFPDAKRGAYILPVKAAVRKKAGLGKDVRARFTLNVTLRSYAKNRPPTLV